MTRFWRLVWFLTLEPGVETGPGRMMVHEEDIVIRETHVEFLSDRAGRDIKVIGA